MKVQSHRASLETNTEVQSNEFGIGDTSVIIDILRNRLYQNKIQSMCQEIISNARDAMREVGKDNTFEVIIPTRLNPTFRVRDFGPGISPDRMLNVFIKYGASTKRKSNNQTGGFGVGAKSPFAYSDSFSITTWLEGVKRAYVAHLGLNNQGSLDLVSTDKTDEPNGTEIQVAVRHDDLREFELAIYRAIYFWADKPTVKGVSADWVLGSAQGHKVNESIETIDRNLLPDFVRPEYGVHALAVIDGIPYPLTDKLLDKASKLGAVVQNKLSKMLILHFGNGLVEVSASRESIADSQFTIDSLNKMGNRASLAIDTYIVDTFAKANSTSEHFQTYKELSRYFPVDAHANFGDFRIECGDIVSDAIKASRMTLVHCLDKRKRHVVDRISKEPLDRQEKKRIPIDMLNRVFLVNKNETKIVQNKRARAFFEDSKSIQESMMILIEYSGDPTITDKLVADLGIKTFESIEYPETPKMDKVKVERENEEFCLHNLSGTRYSYTTLAKNKDKYLYVEVQDGRWEGFNKNGLCDLNWHLLKNQSLRIVGVAPRALKMIKGNENFTPLRNWMVEYKPTSSEVNLVILDAAKNVNAMKTLSKTDGIKDSFLLDMAKQYKAITDESDLARSIPDMLIHKIRDSEKAKAFLEKDDELSKLLHEKYPLVEELHHNSANLKELAFYINAKYTN